MQQSQELFRGLYCVYDVPARQILSGVLYCLPSDEAAQRMFYDTIAQSAPESMFMLHPEDFVLVKVGYVGYDRLNVESFNVGISEPLMTGQVAVDLIRRRQEQLRVVRESVEQSRSEGLIDSNDASALLAGSL